jgi:hypothetical protein
MTVTVGRRKRLVTKTPQTWAGRVAEAVLGALSRSVIVGGAWYRFSKSRGAVIVSDAGLAERVGRTVEDAGQATDADAAYLEAAVGERWSLRTNCVSLFSPVWSGAMGASTAGDRDAIAKRVTVSVVVAAARLIGGGYLVDLWISAKFDNMKRSCARQSGEITKAIREMEGR